MIVSRDVHTELSLFDLSRRKGKDSDQSGHYLDKYLRHHRSGPKLGIDAESSEEIFDAFEKIDQGVVTCPLMHGHLAILNVTRGGAEITREIRTDRRIRMPEKIAFVGGNILVIEGSSPRNE